jgi:hypothetical protein
LNAKENHMMMDYGETDDMKLYVWDDSGSKVREVERPKLKC